MFYPTSDNGMGGDGVNIFGLYLVIINELLVQQDKDFEIEEEEDEDD